MKTALLVMVCFAGILNAQTDYDVDVPGELRPVMSIRTDKRKWYPGELVVGKLHRKVEIMGKIRKRKITVAYNDSTVEDLKPEQFSEFTIYADSEQYKFISLHCDDPEPTGPNSKKLFYVLADGKCQVLVDKSFSIMLFSPLPGSGVTWRYYLYYKGVLTPAGMSEMYYSSQISLKNKCRNIFAECPQLVNSIEDGTYKSTSLAEIVNQFNQCLSTNNSEQSDPPMPGK